MVYDILDSHITKAVEKLTEAKQVSDPRTFLEECLGLGVNSVIQGASRYVGNITKSYELSRATSTALHVILFSLWVANEEYLPNLTVDDIDSSLELITCYTIPKSWSVIISTIFRLIPDSPIKDIAIISTHEALVLLKYVFEKQDKINDAKLGGLLNDLI